MKTALILGSDGGIGFEAAKALSSQGFNLCLGYQNKESIEKKLLISNIPNYKLYCIDVTNAESVNESISKILETLEIDVVVYSVTPPIINKRIKDLLWEDFQQHINVQINGFYNVINALNPLIQKNHKLKFIVILTEYCLGKPPAMISNYITAKYGLMGLVKSMASELSRNNCTFNMISPGMTNTSLLDNLPKKFIEIGAENNPMKRIAEPSDIAKIISFLASDSSDYLNGVNILANGGNIMA